MFESFKFPENFYWGAATSSHQVEGNNLNDWTEWEKENAKRLAKEAENYWQDWQKEKFPQMFNPKNYISGRACDHYNYFEKDFDIAKELGHNAHRFSLEWSRIEPKEGKFDEKEIEHYKEVIKVLRERNIEPFVTLWHWTLPLWVRDLGGWENKKTVDCFTRYVHKIVSSLKNDVSFWITLNEPEIHAGNSYFKGVWPPQKKKIISYFKVIKNLIKGHKESYKIIKELNSRLQIGIAKNNIYFEAYSNSFKNRLLKKLADWWWNFYFLNKIKNYQDFIGLNYYFHNRIDRGFNKNENREISDMGWEIYPEGIYHVLRDLKKYNLPIYITENGIADADDTKRKKFINDHLQCVYKAIQEGVEVRGYFYWSLLDNFEWDKGFWLRFGLVEVDYKTLKRKIRQSAKFYADICKTNRFMIE